MASKTMGEVSREVAEFQPEKLRLSDGSSITIGKLPWMKFAGMYKKCAGLIKAYFAMQRADRQVEAETYAYMQLSAAITPEEREKGSLDEARAVMKASDGAFDDLTAGLLEAPELLVELIVSCSDSTQEYWEDEQRPFTDVLAAGTLAFKLNFGAFKEFAPFFDALMNGLTEAPAEESGTKKKSAKA